MDLEDYSGINESKKQKILAMSDVELIIEIEKGSNSILRNCIPYIKAVLESRKAGVENLDKEQLKEHNEAMLAEAQAANKASIKANRLSIFALVISLLAILLALFKQSA